MNSFKIKFGGQNLSGKPSCYGLDCVTVKSLRHLEVHIGDSVNDQCDRFFGIRLHRENCTEINDAKSHVDECQDEEDLFAFAKSNQLKSYCFFSGTR